jgi:hypothetical protein
MPPRPKSPSQRMPFVWRWRRPSQSLPLVGRVPRRGGRGLCCGTLPTLRHAGLDPASSHAKSFAWGDVLPRVRESFRLTDVRRGDGGWGWLRAFPWRMKVATPIPWNLSSCASLSAGTPQSRHGLCSLSQPLPTLLHAANSPPSLILALVAGIQSASVCEPKGRLSSQG